MFARPASLAAAIALLAALAIHFAPQARSRIEGPLLDAQFRALRSLRAQGEGGVAPVAIVGIDDASLRALGVPLALLHRPLGAALSSIASAGPRAIVLDVALPEHSADALAPGLDAALLEGLARASAAAPLVVAVDADAEGRIIVPHPPLLAAAGGAGALALGLLARDCDGVVRRYEPDPGHLAGNSDGSAPASAASCAQSPGDRAPAGAIALPTLEALLARRVGAAGAFSRAGWIDYSAGERLSYLPLASLAVPDSGAGVLAGLQGRIVLVGSVLAFGDELAQPAAIGAWPAAQGLLAPGLLAHAQAIRSGLGRGLVFPVPARWQWMFIGVFSLLAVPGGARRRLLSAAFAAVAGYALSTALLAQGLRLGLSEAGACAAAALLARPILDLEAAHRASARLLSMFSAHLSPQVLRAKLSADPARAAGRANLAILFADLRGFTAWSEQAPADLVLASLNRWYAAVSPALHARGGTIDNFRGDGVLVVFGAPDAVSRPCDRAFEAARELHRIAGAMSFPAGSPGAPALAPLRVVVGLAWGDAVYGDLGSKERRDFTALGDCANVAARLQDAARESGETLLMTAAFARELSQPVRGLRALGPLALRGHSPVDVLAWSAP
jgi:adenylate cyclase